MFWLICQQVWHHSRSVFGVDTKESINDIHKINDNHVVTVTQNGIITIWYISVPWQLISQVDLSNPPSCISFSCLSYNQNYLAILNESHHLNESHLTLLHIIHENDVVASSTRTQIIEQPCFKYTFAQKATYCDISKNEQYIAVGLESGQISVSLFHDQLVCALYSI